MKNSHNFYRNSYYWVGERKTRYIEENGKDSCESRC